MLEAWAHQMALVCEALLLTTTQISQQRLHRLQQLFLLVQENAS